MAVWSLELGMQPRWHGHAPFSPNPPSNRYGKPHFEHCVCPLTWAPCNPNHIMIVVRMTSRPAVGSRRQVRFDPTISLVLGLDDDWTLQSFPLHESVLQDWPDKPWSACHMAPTRAFRTADERIDPLQHVHANDAQDAQQHGQHAGPFLHEAPQSIQDLFAAFMEEDLIEGEELSEEISLRSWYVHHRRVPEWTVPRDSQLHGHWRFWAADILSVWTDQVNRDEDVALALVFPNPPRSGAFHPVLYDVLVVQGLDLPRRACLATVLRHHDPQQRAERSLAISLPHMVSAKYIAARAHLAQDCHLHDCAVRHGRHPLEWNDRPVHDARDGQSFVIRRPFNSCCSFNHTGCNRCKSFTCCHLC